MILTFNKSTYLLFTTKVYYLAKKNSWHLNFFNEIMFYLLL